MEHSTNQLFLQLAIVLGLSSILGFTMKIFKLPLLVAYLLAGVIISVWALFDLNQSATLSILPEIGIALVLFFIGMELDFAEIKSLGKPILAAGLGQIIISAIFGFVLAQALNFPQTESIFLGIGLSVSSTIVVIKLLIDKKDLSSLYGKLALGILLLEDLVAVVVLMALTVGNSFLNLGLQESLPLLTLVAKGLILLALSLVFARYILQKIFKEVANLPELLFLTAISWCFIFVAVSLALGFSVVIGAFLAGIALANSPFHYEIQGKVKPLRDFFVTLFFVYLGSQVVFVSLGAVLPIMIVFSLYALAVKPLIFLLILGAFGFKKHTIFQSSLSLSQISEFSLIIMVVGFKMGMVSQTSLTAMALTGVISIILSSIMISYSKRIYRMFGKYVGFFEHGKFVHHLESSIDGLELTDHVVVIGAHRMGGKIVEFFKKHSIPLLVLDFNPKIIQKLTEDKINALYGDIGDPEVLDALNLANAKLIISTAQYKDDNLQLLTELRRRKFSGVVIIRAVSWQDAKELYKNGADFVILPEVLAGDFILEHLNSHWPNLSYFKNRAGVELNKLSIS